MSKGAGSTRPHNKGSDMAKYRVIIEGGWAQLPNGRQVPFGVVFDAAATGFAADAIKRLVDNGDVIEVTEKVTYKPEGEVIKKGKLRGKKLDQM